MNSMLRSTVLITASLWALGGCTAWPGGERSLLVSVDPASETTPVDAPIAFEETRLRRGNDVIYNRLGGEVPRGAPTEPIEERQLEEVPSGNAG